jgi:hypothetical protein
MAVRAVARVASRGPDAPVRESREPALRRPGLPVPVPRTPGAPVDQDVTELTLADLVKLVDQRKQGVREVVLDDPTDQDELSESSAPIVLSRGSQAGLAARMLRRR